MSTLSGLAQSTSHDVPSLLQSRSFAHSTEICTGAFLLLCRPPTRFAYLQSTHQSNPAQPR
jgi:hypothetical protein